MPSSGLGVSFACLGEVLRNKSIQGMAPFVCLAVHEREWAQRRLCSTIPLLVILHTNSRQMYFKLSLASICHPTWSILFCHVAIATWQNMARQNGEVLPTSLSLRHILALALTTLNRVAEILVCQKFGSEFEPLLN